MQFGDLAFESVAKRPDLVAAPVIALIQDAQLKEIFVAEIDPALSDTAAFCERYKIGMDVSANCMVVEAKRADRVWYAACVILATDRADINGAVRRQLDARKISFAPMETAVKLTGMEYGGITPIGLPPEWPIFVDESVVKQDWVIIGSGIRKSKLLLTGKALAQLPNTETLNIKKSA